MKEEGYLYYIECTKRLKLSIALNNIGRVNMASKNGDLLKRWGKEGSILFNRVKRLLPQVD